MKWIRLYIILKMSWFIKRLELMNLNKRNLQRILLYPMLATITETRSEKKKKLWQYIVTLEIILLMQNL